MTTTNIKPILNHIGSHNVSFEYARGVKLDNEEVFFYFDVSYRGKNYEVCYRADRYVATDTVNEFWTTWHIHRYNTDGLTDKGRELIDESIKNFISDWLASSAYADSFSSAVASSFRNLIHGERYNTSQIHKAWEDYSHFLNPYNRQKILKAIFALDALIEALR